MINRNIDSPVKHPMMKKTAHTPKSMAIIKSTININT